MTFRPGRGFRVGAMRERITVQSATNDDSTGQRSRTWANLYADEPAAFMPTTGGESIRGEMVEAGISAVFTVRYRSGYSPENRLTHDGETYGIVYVKPVKGGRRYIDLHCKAVNSN